MRNPFAAFDFSGFSNRYTQPQLLNRGQYGVPTFGMDMDVVAETPRVSIPQSTSMSEAAAFGAQSQQAAQPSGWERIKAALSGAFPGARQLNDYGIYGVDEAMKRQAIREGIGSAGALLTQAAFAPSWRQAGPAIANLLPQAIGGYRSSLEDQSNRAVFNKKLEMELEDSDLKVKERALKLAEAQRDWDDDTGMRSSIGDLADNMGQEYLSMLGVEDPSDLKKEQKALWLSFKTQLEIMKKVPKGENLVAALGTYQKLASDLGLEETAARRIQVQLEELAAKSGFVLPTGEPDVAGYTKNEQEERKLDRRYKQAQIDASNRRYSDEPEDVKNTEINAQAKLFQSEADAKLNGITVDPATGAFSFTEDPSVFQADLMTNGSIDQAKVGLYMAQKEFASELAVLTLQARQRGMNVPTEVLLQWLINRKAGK